MYKVRNILVLALVLALAAFAPAVDASLLSCDMGDTEMTDWRVSDLDAVTSGGSWTQSGGPDTQELVSDGGDPADVGLLWDHMYGGDYIEVDLDSAADFSSSSITASWQMAICRGWKANVWVKGFDSTGNEVFAARWRRDDTGFFQVQADENDMNWSKIGDYDYFLRYDEAYDPSAMLDVSVEMSGTNLTFNIGSEENGDLQTITRPGASGGSSDLKSIRFTYRDSTDCGFWLDNVEVIPEPATFGMLGFFGIVYILRRKLMKGC